MKRGIVQALACAAVLLLAMSLSGCLLNFTIVGKEDYTVTSEGLQGGPAKVLVTVRGAVPKWPEVVVYEITGEVHNDGLNEAQLDALADALSGAMYDYLGFDSFSGSTLEGNPFWISKEEAMPSISEWLIIGAKAEELGPYEWDLHRVIGHDFYEALMAELERLCDEELTDPYYGTTVDIKLKGTMKTSYGSVIATLDCDFTVVGPDVV